MILIYRYTTWIMVAHLSSRYNSAAHISTENTVITLADWYHTAANLINGTAYVVRVSCEPRPKLLFRRSNSVLVNGLGRFPNGTNSSLTVIEVEQGKRSVALHTYSRHELSSFCFQIPFPRSQYFLRFELQVLYRSAQLDYHRSRRHQPCPS